jgi:HEPN domain-containing protein
MHVPLDDRVRRWLDQAETDLAIARELRERYSHQACFHAQQSAGKSLKALITRLSGDATPTHEIGPLLGAMEHLGIGVRPGVRSEAGSLEKYYIATRYPDALGSADAALAFKLRDADIAIASAETVRAWCVDALSAARLRDPDPP